MIAGNRTNSLYWNKIVRTLWDKLHALVGDLAFDLEDTLRAMTLRPFELHLELTNLCNADCVFCPYQFQERPKQFMSDRVFLKAVDDFVAIQGGSVGLTPIVGDALIDPKFLERVRYLRGLPAIDRIFVTTNGILLDRFGITELLTSGVSTINISTASFNRENYEKIYRSKAYERMKNNVTQLVEENAKMGKPVNISIGLRTDRPLNEVLQDPDIQPILQHHPAIDFTWSFTSVGGRITREMLPPRMSLRKGPVKREPCINLYNGPIVLPDGDVLACPCVAAMDAIPDLLIGNILQENLLEIYTGKLLRDLREQFRPGGKMNKTCATCELYRDLEFYRTKGGRTRAELNERRHAGNLAYQEERPYGIFKGG